MLKFNGCQPSRMSEVWRRNKWWTKIDLWGTSYSIEKGRESAEPVLTYELHATIESEKFPDDSKSLINTIRNVSGGQRSIFGGLEFNRLR